MAAPWKVLILQHWKENPRKCTVPPLRGRPDVEVRVLRPGPSDYVPEDLAGGILLAVEAPPLSPEDRAILDADPARRLVLVDANWVKVPRILRALRPAEPLVPRSLPPGIVTAYPRKSKLYEDPSAGLATVEAVAAAVAILGFPDRTFLDGYRWGGRFIELNPGLRLGAPGQ